MIKCATSFKLNQVLTADALNEALQAKAFAEIGSTDMESVGFVPYADGLPLVHEGAGIRIGKVRIDKKSLPGSAVKEKLKERLQKVEESQGYKPGRKQTNEIKEQIVDELLPTALATTKYIPFYIWDDRVLIESTASASVDVVIGLFAKCIKPFPIVPLRLNESPAASMTSWLVTDEAPEGFTIDQEVEMKSTNESAASVRWLNQTVDPKVAREHLEQGKQCVRMAMTWGDKWSFVIDDQFVLKKIKANDIFDENQEEPEPKDIDGNLAIYGKSVYCLIDALIQAHGGLQVDAA